MSENPEARPSGRDLLARQEASEYFELAQSGGSWMVVGGFIAASMWVGAAAGVILGYYGVPALMALNPFILAGGSHLWTPLPPSIRQASKDFFLNSMI